MKKRLVWISQAATSLTGLGKSTRYILSYLKKEFDVTNLGYNHYPQNLSLFKDIDYPIIGLDLGKSKNPGDLGEGVQRKLVEGNYDIAVFFGDLRYFTYLPGMIGNIPDVSLVGYITVDCSNLPIHWLPIVSTFDHLITTSLFASEEIKKVYDRECPVIYLGHNPKIWNPNNRAPLKGLEKNLLNTCRIDRNQTRKNWVATLDIWNTWSSDKEVNLLAHTSLEPEEEHSLNLKHYMYNLKYIHSKMTLSRQYISEERDFAQIFKGSDIFLTTSMGEGFGLPILEAAACGTPSIGIDFSASGELIKAGAGVALNPGSFYANQEGVKMALPNYYDFLVALDRVYSDKKYLKELSERAVGWARPLTWEMAANKFINELSEQNLKMSALKVRFLDRAGKLNNLPIERLV